MRVRTAALLLLFTPPLCAQEAASERLEALRQELAVETQALESLRAAGDSELEGLRATRRELATELLTLTIAEERTQATRLELEAEAARAERELARRLDELRAIHGATQSALERMLFTTRTIPGMLAQSETSRADALLSAEVRATLPDAAALLDALADGTRASPELGLDVVQRTLAAYGASLAEATAVQVVAARIFTAGGLEEDVQLLRAGLVAFAYRTGDGRVGLALASPVDASGLRWSEELDDAVAAQVGAAIDAAAAGQALVLPIDPTGQVRSEALSAKQSLRERLAGGGPLMVPLGLVALAALLLALERIVTLFIRNRRAHGLAHRILEEVSAARHAQAARLCDTNRGIIPRTLGACLARASQGKLAMEDAIQEQLLNELPAVSRFLRTLAILAAVAPLVGLLGTVTGIIQTFGVIKALGTTDPTLMAGGISVALVTTAAGLSVAIPTMLAQGLLKGRGDRLIADAERYAASLLTLLAHGESHAQESSEG